MFKPAEDASGVAASCFATLALPKPAVYFAADVQGIDGMECEKRFGACVLTSYSAD